MKNIFLFIVLFLVVIGYSKSDALRITISLTEGEHSKDSWSSETNISIDGSEIAYTKTYSGHRGTNQKDVSKTCTFTDQQMSDIQNYIKDKNLMRSDSLIDNEEKYKSFERFVNLSMFLAMWERISKINVNGDVSNLEDKDLYKNCYGLIDLITTYLDTCN